MKGKVSFYSRFNPKFSVCVYLSVRLHFVPEACVQGKLAGSSIEYYIFILTFKVLILLKRHSTDLIFERLLGHDEEYC